MTDKFPTMSLREEIVEKALERNNTDFTTIHEEDLDLARHKWEEKGLKVVDITIESGTSYERVMESIKEHTSLVGDGDGEATMDDFYEAMGNSGLGRSLALCIRFKEPMEPSDQSKFEGDIRHLMQSCGLSYIIYAEDPDKIPVELKVSAYPIE